MNVVRLAAAFSLLAAACGTPTERDAPALGTIVSVRPADSAPGREETVRIEGTFDLAGGELHVSFGEGVVAESVSLDGSAIVARLSVAEGATLGPRDVVVEQGGREAVRAAGFEVRAPFTANPVSIPAGAHATIRVRGFRTAWDAATTIAIDERLQLVEARVDANDDLELDVRADLFGASGPLSIAVAGERASPLELAPPPMESLTARAERSGTLSGAGDFRVWEAAIGEAEALLFRAAGKAGSFDPVYEIYEAPDGFSPATWLWEGGAAIERALVGRPVRIVLRNPSAGDAPYAFSFHRAPASAIEPGVPAAQVIGAAEGIAAFRVSPAPWSVVEFRVDPQVTMQPIAFTSHEGSWQFAREDAPTGAAVYPRALASPHDASLSVVVGDAAGQSGVAVEVTAAVSPLPGALFAREAVSLAVPDGGSAGDVLSVSGAPAIAAVHLAIDIAHPYRGDLRVTLTSPAGTSATVVLPDWSDFRRDRVTAFPDVEPAWEDLAVFAGESPNGDWRLEVADEFPGEAGVLRGWAISVE